MPVEMFETFIEEDFGEGVSYDDALESLRETKRWGAKDFSPTKEELAQYKNLTAVDWVRTLLGCEGFVADRAKEDMREKSPALLLTALLVFIEIVWKLFFETPEERCEKMKKTDGITYQNGRSEEDEKTSAPNEKEAVRNELSKKNKDNASWLKKLSLNSAQKVVVLIVAGLLCLILALHNPFGGYRTRSYDRPISFFDYKSHNCSFEAVDEIGEASGMMIPLVVFGGIAALMLKT